MKLKITLLAALAFFAWNPVQAQNEQGQSTVTAGVGYSLIANLVNSALDTYDSIDNSSVPTIAITFDHALTDKFSLGIAASIQNSSADFVDTYLDANQVLQTDNVSASLTRYNVAIRPLFHYGGNDALDLYSGLRIGITGWASSYESNQDDFSVGGFDGSRLSVGLVAFGMRYYFTDNIGVNFDLQVGAPYIISGGIAAKF